MPPTSNTRKSSTATMTMTEPHSFLTSTLTGPPVGSAAAAAAAAAANHNAALQPRRSTSGRAIRVNTTRPANYYARPFGSVSTSAGGGGANGGAGDHAPESPAGFFPALHFFSDAITALPKEVMRQFTLMKEAEAKIHEPAEKLGEMLDGLMALPVPSRQEAAAAAAIYTGAQGVLVGSTADNSVMGSANPSLVNGVTGSVTGQQPSVQLSAFGSVNGEESAANATMGETTEEDKLRRRRYHELRALMHGLLVNMDEKNVVLAEANRVLSLQEQRINSVMPHIDGEISEEARLGSMTHWAYAENRQKKQTTASGAAAASRRDVAATNSLAAAASAVHEHEIAQARRDAGREATREKTKGKRTEHPIDSDFDEKPRRAPKGAKGKSTANLPASGLGTAALNGEPAAKRKKTDKAAAMAAASAGMERTASATGRSSKAFKDTPRSTPAAEPRKVPKAKSAPAQPKKKIPSSAHASPMLASSPPVSTVTPAPNAEPPPPPSARPQSTRLRQNSSAANARIEKIATDENSSRPPSSGGRPNGSTERSNARRKAVESGEGHGHEDEKIVEHIVKPLAEAQEQLPPEDVDMRDDANQDPRPVLSRSESNSQKTSGRASKAGTPRNESFADRDVAMVRTRSTRSKPGTRTEGRDSSSSEPQPASTNVSKHRRIISNSNLVKQLAPFNRSPDLDRHLLRDNLEEDADSLDDKANVIDPAVVPEDQAMSPVGPIPESERETRRSSVRRPLARNSVSSRWRSGHEALSPDQTPPATAHSSRTRHGGNNISHNGTADTSPVRTVAKSTEHIKDGPLDEPIVPFVPEPAPSTQADFEHDRGTEDQDVEEEADGGEGAAAATGIAAAAATVEPEDEEDDGSGSDHDPDDPNEPKYCYCNRGSYGEMVACDNDACPREWFHLGCTELRDAPGEEEKWYCRDCRPKFTRKSRGGRAVVGR